MSFLSPVHIVFFAAVALLALGPKRFPEFTKALGNTMREFREVMSGLPGRDTLMGADAKPQAAPVGTPAPEPAASGLPGADIQSPAA
jgi:Sec-independent protein translocase protein TatA